MRSVNTSWPLAAVFFLFALLSQSAYAAWPDKPLRMIVPWPAGAATDAAARVIAERLATRLGQPVIVDNRPGASGIIGTGIAAKSPADGYTLVIATADTHSINPHVYKTLPYDALKSFDPIVMFGRIAPVWIARPGLEANSLQDLVAAAKRTPGKISYGSWGIGSTAHVSGALLEAAAGIELLHVPFQGAAPALQALLGGTIDIMPFSGPVASANQKAGKVKIIGVAGAARALPWLPDTKTLAEQGVKDAEMTFWYGVVVPAGMAPDLRERIVREVVAILKQPEVLPLLVNQGMEPVVMPAAEFGQFMQAEFDRLGAVIKRKGIEITQ